MLAWFSKPRHHFSLENLKYQYGILKSNVPVTEQNKLLVVETLRTIAELMIWGDQNNEQFFFFFCEKSVLVVFLQILECKCDRLVVVQLLQTMSMMIQNFNSETSMYYLLSNNHVNDIIVHQFDFSNEEILAYYITFLKTLSLRLNSNTLQFFFDHRTNDFPLYTEAVKFFNNEDNMVRIAVKTLTLNVYRVNEPDLRAFILNRHAVPYFSNLVFFIRDEACELDSLLLENIPSNQGKLLQKIDQQIDTYHYLMEIFRLHIRELSDVLMDQLLSNLILPLVVGSLVSRQFEYQISTKTSCFLLSHIFSIFDHIPLVNSLVTSLLHPSPPKLSIYLCQAPPQFPIDSASSHIHISDVLYSHHERNESVPDLESLGSDNSYHKPEQDKAILQRDLNLQKVRSKLPEMTNVTSIEEYEGFNLPAQLNPYRNAILSFLDSSSDQEVFGSLSVLITLVENKNVDISQLIECNICPQKDRRSRRLFDALTSPLDEEPSPDASPSRQSPPVYDDRIIESLISILGKPNKINYSVQTLRMAQKLLIDLVCDSVSGNLKPAHSESLDEYAAQHIEFLKGVLKEFTDPSIVECMQNFYRTLDTPLNMSLVSSTFFSEESSPPTFIGRTAQTVLIVRNTHLFINRLPDPLGPLLLHTQNPFKRDELISLQEDDVVFECSLVLEHSALEPACLVLKHPYLLIAQQTKNPSTNQLSIFLVVEMSTFVISRSKEKTAPIAKMTIRSHKLPHVYCDRLPDNLSDDSLVRLWGLSLQFETSEYAESVVTVLTDARNARISEYRDEIVKHL